MEVPDYSRYRFYEDGRVWAKARGMFLTGSINRQGRPYYGLWRDTGKRNEYTLKDKVVGLYNYYKERGIEG